MNFIGSGGHYIVLREFAMPQNDGWIIAVGDNATRRRIALEHEGMRPPIIYATMIHPAAVVSPSAHIGVGSVIMAGAIVQANTSIGNHVILNTGCTVDHGCVVEDYAHIAPGAHLCGDVHIGEGTLVGVGVGIAPMCKVPAWTLVKARRLEMEPLYAV